MPVIKLSTVIHAPLDRCFDLARSIDLHKESMQHTGETAISGVTTGLIQFGETVAWRAKHLGLWHTLTSQITALQYPVHFRDEMVSGPFKSIRHDHYFTAKGDATLMQDDFHFETPLGLIGKLFNVIYLNEYLRVLLIRRNEVIKTAAESSGENC